MSNNFIAMSENGQPIVFDKISRVAYEGYATDEAAIKHASELNSTKNEPANNFGSDYFSLIEYYETLK